MVIDFTSDENNIEYTSSTAYDYAEYGILYTFAIDRCEDDTDYSIKDSPTLYDYSKNNFSVLLEKGYEWNKDIPQIIITHTDNNLYEFFDLENRLDYVY